MDSQGMKRNFLYGSFILLGLSILLWFAITLFESSLAGMSFATQRLMTFFLLVLPAGMGVGSGIMSFARKEGRAGWAIMSIVLNALFASFFLTIVLLAG